jgi:Family of unknown function (DUF6526)
MQTAESHAHHPVPTYIASALWLASALAFAASLALGWNTQSLAFLCLLLAVFVNISIARLYTTKLQDRIIRLEMQVRCAALLPPGADARLAQLSPKQVVALRFASDPELASLLDRAVRESMTPVDIKKAIRQWRPDPHRT